MTGVCVPRLFWYRWGAPSCGIDTATHLESVILDYVVRLGTIRPLLLQRIVNLMLGIM
jgi:hypothetical protein